MTRNDLLNVSSVIIALQSTQSDDLTWYDLQYLNQLNTVLQSVLYRHYGDMKYKLIALNAREVCGYDYDSIC